MAQEQVPQPYQPPSAPAAQPLLPPQPPAAMPGIASEFKPNIYPIMYWALAFGAIAGVLLFLMFWLSRFITVIWFPVFLAGLIWGGYRNYQKQKQQWFAAQGQPVPHQSASDEFREAVQDIVSASREMMTEEAVEPAPTDQPPPEYVPPAESAADPDEQVIPPPPPPPAAPVQTS